MRFSSMCSLAGGQKALLGLLAASFATVHAAAPTLPLPTRLVHQFALGTWLENLYVRSNGDLLVTTMVAEASVYLVSNPAAASPVVTLIHRFDEVDSLLGITETEPGLFAVAGLRSTSPGDAINGTAGVWEIDLRRAGSPKVRLITSMPNAILLNGMVGLPASPNTVLIADSTRALVWRLDIRTGKYTIAIQDPTMNIAEGAFVPIGINGVKIHQDYLYWTNGFESNIYRVRITRDGYRAPGAKVELVSHVNSLFLDDLVFGPGDNDLIWTPTDLDNMVIGVDERKNGSATVVDGSLGELTVAGGTACLFGRGLADKETLYLVTSGGAGKPSERDNH
ncbi:hypothetical protein GQ53DRAFT_878111 [Thozetella sp. PMI_491]|nr:hypothetical protein GQ53DRAFT_878111 [Thozetella sp. PMI_491]